MDLSVLLMAFVALGAIAALVYVVKVNAKLTREAMAFIKAKGVMEVASLVKELENDSEIEIPDDEQRLNADEGGGNLQRVQEKKYSPDK